MDYVLKHYGVKGMKWGVRKERERKGSIRGSSNSIPTTQKVKKKESKKLKILKYGITAASAFLSANKLMKLSNVKKKNAKVIKQGEKVAEKALKNISEMSDAELSKRIERIRLENRYKELVTPQQPQQPQQQSTAQTITKITTDLANWSDSAIRLYNNYEKVKKIFEDRNKERG